MVSSYIHNYGRIKITPEIREEERMYKEEGDAWNCYYLAKTVDGVNIKELKEVVAESKDSLWICAEFAENIVWHSHNILFKRILEHGNGFDCYWCLLIKKKLENSTIKELHKAITTRGSARDCWLTARDIKGAPLKALMNRAYELNGIKYAVKIRDMINRKLTPEEELKQAKLLKEKNAYACCIFAKNTIGSNIKALQEVVRKKGSPGMCWIFARCVVGADKEMLVREAMRMEPEKYSIEV